MHRILIPLLTLAFGAPAAHAQTAAPSDLQVALWAASCMACHGTDGRADGPGLELIGRPADELTGILLAYKRGDRTGTIMHQHARGYTDDELQRIAAHFAALRP